MRLVSLVVAVVLSPSVVPWVPGTGCPHHTGTGAHSAESADGHAGPTDGHGATAAGHGNAAGEHAAHHGARLAGHGPDSESSHAPPPCDCLGKCPVPAGPALPVTDGLRLASQTFVAASSGPSASPRLPFGRAPYTLPYANGPPLS